MFRRRLYRLRFLPKPALVLLFAGVLLGTSGCASGPGSPGSPASGPQAQVSCPDTGPQTVSGTLTASGDHFVGDGLDVTSVASLDPRYGVNGTIDVIVTVSCPTQVSDVSVEQSYEAWGSTVGASLSELSRSGNTWTFALFADDLSGSHPYQVGLYKGALSGSGQQPFAVIVFSWPASIVQHMAS